MTFTDDAVAVADAALAALGPQDSWKGFRGYPDSLALCAIDSTFSLRARYSTVGSVINRYRTVRVQQGGSPETDGTRDLRAAIEAHGGAHASAESLFENRSVAPGTKRLKSEALYAAVSTLDLIGIHSTDDLRQAVSLDVTRAPVERAWLSTKGLGNASWNYLLMLAGQDGVKADRMIIRFVQGAVGNEPVSPDRAHRAVLEAAEKLGVPAAVLDHTIWRHESSRAKKR